MPKLDFNRVLRDTLAALTLALMGGLVVASWQQSRTVHLTLAAGASSGESYILGNGLKTVVERHYPRIRITLLQTGGTVENLKMLEDGRPTGRCAVRYSIRGQGSSRGCVIQRHLSAPGTEGLAGEESGRFARPAHCTGPEWRTIPVVSPCGGSFWPSPGGFSVCRRQR
jgi:hypothetical protein